MVMNLQINSMKTVRLKSAIVLLAFTLLFSGCNPDKEVRINILQTTDIHGVILPWDFIENQELPGSMAQTSTIVDSLRKASDAFFLLDNGDNLQGQPAVYYYNFIDTTSVHFLAEAMNLLGFDASTVGNHDIEAGHNVYDRIAGDYNFPMLAANAVSTKTGEPYFKPYVIIEKNSLRIAVLGLITPSVPTWLPPELYSGIEFRDMLETAKEYMPEILNEKPDLVVGLFHSGWNDNPEFYREPQSMNENGASSVAWNVPGFDIIFTGHDHRLANQKFVNMAGDTVLILNGGSRSEYVAVAEIVFQGTDKKITGKILETKEFPADADFLDQFANNDKIIREYVEKVLATNEISISSRDAFFGSSAFIDMIHKMQIEITGADISFAAPLSFDVTIEKGPVTVSDMFKLYRFENMLYNIKLTGAEIDKYLEYSYSLWLNEMKNENDYLLNYRTGDDGKPVVNDGRLWLRNQSYNFDSAFGIDYIVDASKPAGNKVTISKFSDGTAFVPDSMYTVAINSYRGNGGGGHLTNGVGLNEESLRSRLVSSTDKDLRYYLMKAIEDKKVLSPKPAENWKIIPEKWVTKARSKETKMLFN